MRKWKREQVSSVRLAFAGAEKLNQNVREKFHEKLGISILEGYGVTESCSCATVNLPNDYCHGSVGKPLQDIQCKIVDPDNYEDLSEGEEGLVLIKGPSIMKEYYKSPELTKHTFHDGFYITGDVGKISNGFLFITDRLKRFAKIGGELIPLTPIEDKLSLILDENAVCEKRGCAVVNIPHSQKGEQVVAFVVKEDPDKLTLNKGLDILGVPNLHQPSLYVPIDTIPLLPSGKVDYKLVKKLAIDKCVPVT
jgi:acyl-[acyl-carrier-protein]-phospholipid O-acyltransferase/long-chain-fatty-acid--[acyl-carrier-protein] ligase